MDAFDVLHEQWQIAEVAPERVKRLARSIDGDGTADEIARVVRGCGQTGRRRIRILERGRWRIALNIGWTSLGHVSSSHEWWIGLSLEMPVFGDCRDEWAGGLGRVPRPQNSWTVGRTE